MSFIVFSQLLLLNVFVAVVLKNFEEEMNRDDEEKAPVGLRPQ